MAYGRRDPSIFDNFTLSPLPYPVLFILLMVIVLLLVSSYFNYEELLESAEEQMSFALLLTPLILLLLIRFLGSTDSLFDGSGPLGFVFPSDRRRTRSFYERGTQQEGGGASPWGVAVAVVVLIVLASFRSSFEDMWGP
ncbi:hypothetical protein KFK09_019029 [Dendrobium nobile]|uniref:Transmembrane protein n=1 Tax=Dendrobium nobile TaxID=94219 RepID=A0A8T3AYS1_DENNO|nr:hypothetical protein KFK09_019029 [Dendrobium nobile]